jgi:hypothetical protein
MSPLSIGKILTIVLLSSVISTASTVGIMTYAPSLVPMIVPKPALTYESVSTTTRHDCEMNIEWSDIPEMVLSIYVHEDSSLVIILSIRTEHLPNAQIPGDYSHIFYRAMVDGASAEPEDVQLIINQYNPQGYTMVFHASSVSKGLHTVTIQWRNQSSVKNILRLGVLQVLSVPNK